MSCVSFSTSFQKTKNRDFPGGAVDKSLPANAGDTGSTPGPGRSHMSWSSQAHESQLLSPSTATSEALMPSSLCSAIREATAMRSLHTTIRSSSCWQQLENARKQQ